MPRLETRFGTLPSSDYVPDVLAQNLKIIFCGTALGYMSAKHQAYYAHPGNFFWKTLHRTGITPHVIAPKDYRTVLHYRLGLTDLCKNAYGLDTQLPKNAFDVNAARVKIMCYQPAILAFTSKTAAAAYMGKPTEKIPYGLQHETDGKTKLFVLPSPSGQARVFWNESIWQDLSNLSSF